MYSIYSKDYNAVLHAMDIVNSMGTCSMPYKNNLKDTSCSNCFYGKINQHLSSCIKPEVLEAAKEYLSTCPPEELLTI